MKISAVIITKNEEKNIARCLESLKWCDEIILIDDYSTDRTVEIARDRGAKVFKHSLNNNFASQRNFGLTKAKNDWVLFLDADEILPYSLFKEIVRRLKKEDFDGYFIPRKEFFFGKPLYCYDKPANDWSFGPIKLLRLAKKKKGEWQGKVHEKWVINGKISVLKNSIEHYSFSDLTLALRKINFYSSLASEEFKARGKKVKTWEIFLYPLGKFLKDFFWHSGWKNGTRGLIYCLLMSLQSFLTRAKLRCLYGI